MYVFWNLDWFLTTFIVDCFLVFYPNQEKLCTLHLIWNEILSQIFEIHNNGPWITVYSTNLAIKTILVCTISDFLPKNCTKSHQHLTNVQCCNRHNHGQTIHPTEIFISMTLLQMSCMITYAYLFLTFEVIEELIYWKKYLVKVSQQPQKPLSGSNQIWATTSEKIHPSAHRGHCIAA